MLVRAGASNREMALAMGVNIKLLFTLVFGVGAALCALAGAMLAPLFAVQVGMGENILILAFVVIVIGGIGSIRGALVGAVLVGVVDTIGRAFLPILFGAFFQPRVASAAGPALASVMIYLSWRSCCTSGRRACFRRADEAASSSWCCCSPPSRWRCRRSDYLFYVSFASRVMIYAIAATSLNLVLGYGGMMSFGHAAFVGTGAYVGQHPHRRRRDQRLDRLAGGDRRLRARSPGSSAPSRCARAACTSS